MTIDDRQIQALVFLAKGCRPSGAKGWDEAGTFANIAKIRNRPLPSVILATIRAAADRDVETPGVIPSNGSHWAEAAAVRTFVPHIVKPEHRCGICAKAREKCQRERVADDDHAFEPATAKPPSRDVHRTVAALKTTDQRGASDE